MLEAFQQFIFKNHLCSKEDKILIALSGGIDSVVLLNLFYRAEYFIGIAHCNFKLRGDESDQDEIFVRELAKKYKIEIHVKICDASAYAGSNKSVHISNSVRKTSTHIIGRSGSGKSTQMENMIMQDIQTDNGVAVIDPHDDTIKRLFHLIPENFTSQSKSSNFYFLS